MAFSVFWDGIWKTWMAGFLGKDKEMFCMVRMSFGELLESIDFPMDFEC